MAFAVLKRLCKNKKIAVENVALEQTVPVDNPTAEAFKDEGASDGVDAVDRGIEAYEPFPVNDATVTPQSRKQAVMLAESELPALDARGFVKAARRLGIMPPYRPGDILKVISHQKRLSDCTLVGVYSCKSHHRITPLEPSRLARAFGLGAVAVVESWNGHVGELLSDGKLLHEKAVKKNINYPVIALEWARVVGLDRIIAHKAKNLDEFVVGFPEYPDRQKAFLMRLGYVSRISYLPISEIERRMTSFERIELLESQNTQDKQSQLVAEKSNNNLSTAEQSRGASAVKQAQRKVGDNEQDRINLDAALELLLSPLPAPRRKEGPTQPWKNAPRRIEKPKRPMVKAQALSKMEDVLFDPTTHTSYGFIRDAWSVEPHEATNSAGAGAIEKGVEKEAMGASSETPRNAKTFIDQEMFERLLGIVDDSRDTSNIRVKPKEKTTPSNIPSKIPSTTPGTTPGTNESVPHIAPSPIGKEERMALRKKKRLEQRRKIRKQRKLDKQARLKSKPAKNSQINKVATRPARHNQSNKVATKLGTKPAPRMRLVKGTRFTSSNFIVSWYEPAKNSSGKITSFKQTSKSFSFGTSRSRYPSDELAKQAADDWLERCVQVMTQN
ncbi:hypothetical protein KO116_P200111 (plasmid) [Halomonas sp. KO116]|nr:hypothetical protein KO116_P200111 [Halomonas sp. KO116]